MSEPVTAFDDWRQREERTSSREGARPAAPEEAEGVLDLRIVQALERAPEVRIPEDFAARVAASVPARTVRLRQARLAARAPVRRVAYAMAVVCLVAVAASMVALARHSGQRVFYQVLECVLAFQFCIVAAWVARSRGASAK